MKNKKKRRSKRNNRSRRRKKKRRRGRKRKGEEEREGGGGKESSLRPRRRKRIRTPGRITKQLPVHRRLKTCCVGASVCFHSIVTSKHSDLVRAPLTFHLLFLLLPTVSSPKFRLNYERPLPSFEIRNTNKQTKKKRNRSTADR